MLLNDFNLCKFLSIITKSYQKMSFSHILSFNNGGEQQGIEKTSQHSNNQQNPEFDSISAISNNNTEQREIMSAIVVVSKDKILKMTKTWTDPKHSQPKQGTSVLKYKYKTKFDETKQINGNYYYLICQKCKNLPQQLTYKIKIDFSTGKEKFYKKGKIGSWNIQIISQQNLLMTDTTYFLSYLLLLENKRKQGKDKIIQQLKQKFKDIHIDPKNISLDDNYFLKDTTFETGSTQKPTRTFFRIRKYDCLELFTKVTMGIFKHFYYFLEFIRVDVQIFSQLQEKIKQQTDRKLLATSFIIIADKKLKNEQQDDEICHQIMGYCLNIIISYSSQIEVEFVKKLNKNLRWKNFIKSIEFKQWFKLLQANYLLDRFFFYQMLSQFIEEKKSLSSYQLVKFLSLINKQKEQENKIQDVSQNKQKKLSQEIPQLLNKHLCKNHLDAYLLTQLGISEFKKGSIEYEYIEKLIKHIQTQFDLDLDNLDIAVSQRQLQIKKIKRKNIDPKIIKILWQKWMKFKETCISLEFSKENFSQDLKKLITLNQYMINMYIQEAKNAKISDNEKNQIFKKFGQIFSQSSIESHKYFNKMISKCKYIQTNESINLNNRTKKQKQE